MDRLPPGFFLPVRVLSRLFRRLFIEELLALHRARNLVFFGDLARLAEADTFAAWLAPFRKSEWWSTPSLPSVGLRPCWPSQPLYALRGYLQQQPDQRRR